MPLAELLIILVLVLANGLFSGAEIAIIAARRSRLEQLASEGDRKARMALALANDPNRFLPTVQVGITLIGTFAAAFGGATLVEYVQEHLERIPLSFVAERSGPLSLTLVVLFITCLSLILGELVPKRLALGRAETLARFVAPIMTFIAIVARPIIWLMGAATNAVLFLLGSRNAPEPRVSVDDIEHLIATGRAEGVLDSIEQKVAVEALRLGDRTVRDVMRPRIDLDALDVTTPPEEVIGAVAMAGFSRLPVYENDLDHIIGFVHIKDLFRQQYLGWPIQLRRLLHPALFVPQTVTLDRLLQLFQANKTQLAVVLDEYGGTQGMVTMEDVIEELVGEIGDEHHRDEQQAIVQRDEHSWLLDGGVSIFDLIETLELKPSDVQEARSYSTISGLILDQLGRIPSVGDRTKWENLELEVVDMDGLRIDRVMVTRHPPTDGQLPEGGRQ